MLSKVRGCRCVLQFPMQVDSIRRTLFISSPIFAKKCHYETLGVPKTASQGEIRNAYLEKVKDCHPDANPDDDKTHKAFLSLQEAYSILKNKYTRTRYDLDNDAFEKGDDFRRKDEQYWDIYGRKVNDQQQDFHSNDFELRKVENMYIQIGASVFVGILGLLLWSHLDSRYTLKTKALAGHIADHMGVGTFCSCDRCLALPKTEKTRTRLGYHSTLKGCPCSTCKAVRHGK